MADKPAQAGEYVLTGVQWRKRHENGSYTLYRRGDVVELNAEEAARLAGKANSSFKSKAQVEKERKAREAYLKALAEQVEENAEDPTADLDENSVADGPQVPPEGGAPLQETTADVNQKPTPSLKTTAKK